MDQHKRKVSTRIIDENFVSAKTNVVTKWFKLSANATSVASIAVKQRQASVEDDNDDEIMSVNNPPKNPNVLLKATDGSDKDEDNMDLALELEDTEPYGEDDDNDDDDKPEIIKSVEMAETQQGESMYHRRKFCLTFPIRTPM